MLYELERELSKMDFDALSRDELIGLLKSIRDRLAVSSPSSSKKNSNAKWKGLGSPMRVNLMPIVESKADLPAPQRPPTTDTIFLAVAGDHQGGKKFSVPDFSRATSAFTGPPKEGNVRALLDADLKLSDPSLPGSSEKRSPSRSEDHWYTVASTERLDETSSLSSSSYSSFSDSDSIPSPHQGGVPLRNPLAESRSHSRNEQSGSLVAVRKTVVPSAVRPQIPTPDSGDAGSLLRNESSDDFFSPHNTGHIRVLTSILTEGGAPQDGAPKVSNESDRPLSPSNPLKRFTCYCGAISQALHMTKRPKKKSTSAALLNETDSPLPRLPEPGIAVASFSPSLGVEDDGESMCSGILEIGETGRLRKRKDRKTGAKYINGFCLIKEIGRGSTSKVKLAYDNSTNRLVAIKQVRRTSTKFRAGGPSESQQVFMGFLREIDIVKKLRHRNIVSVYEVIDDPNASVLCLVMQYIDNGPIRKLEMKPNSDVVCEPIESLELLGYAKQMLAGLVYLHRHDVIHRDIKPENILISKEKRIYLADFGVAETFDDEYRAKLERLMATSVEAVVHNVADAAASGPVVRGIKGTMLFLAPELWTPQRSSGKPVDIWAMGVTLYVLLTGRLPFTKLEDIVNPQLHVTPTTYGDVWDTLIGGMLNRSTLKRFTAQQAYDLVSRYYLEERMLYKAAQPLSCGEDSLSSASGIPCPTRSPGSSDDNDPFGQSPATAMHWRHLSRSRLPKPPSRITAANKGMMHSSAFPSGNGLHTLSQRPSKKLGQTTPVKPNPKSPL